MAVTTVQHAGRDVISSDQGGWIYTPGLKPEKNIQPVRLARSTRMKVKEFATEGSRCSLSITFVGTQAEWNSFRDDLAGMYDGTIGNLVVPGHPTESNTVFTGSPTVGEQKKVADTDGGTDQYMYEIDVELLIL